MLKVLIIDDNEIIRDSLWTIIEQDPDINVVGSASNGMEAAILCKSLIPDVVLMDIHMPVCNGIEGTKLIKAQNNSIKILILTTFSDDEYISEALQGGGDGYVLKGIKDEDLISIIKTTAKGFSIVQQSVFNNFKSQYKDQDKESSLSEANLLKYPLTNKEMEIIALIVDGLSNKEIAAKLYTAEGTVRNAVSNILTKLNLMDRTQLAVFAIKNNLV